ncbi:MAG: hypothetical protein E6J02_02915 [Chloroflexi bacterium]|nr:MAG: hypothetical protein E6J02_02915 [Chloroflexota bacterium]
MAKPATPFLSALVERHGATTVAAVASLLFLLPLAAWAGAVDLYPSPAVWATGAVGLVLIVPWILISRRAFSLQAHLRSRVHRFEWRQMSGSEKSWAARFLLGAVAILGWVNGAATVDLGALGPGLAAGRASVYAFVAGALLLLAALIVFTAWCWRRNGTAFRLRSGQPAEALRSSS